VSRFIKTASHVNENYEKRIHFSGFEIDKEKPGGGSLSGKSSISTSRVLVRRRKQVEVQRALVGVRASAHEV
jgi:hypothetical protein